MTNSGAGSTTSRAVKYVFFACWFCLYVLGITALLFGGKAPVKRGRLLVIVNGTRQLKDVGLLCILRGDANTGQGRDVSKKSRKMASEHERVRKSSSHVLQCASICARAGIMHECGSRVVLCIAPQQQAIQD
jgi:hypothetical protein